MNYNSFRGLKVTIMGLGLHGGGIASARFFAEAGAVVTVTDLADPGKLAKSVEKLKDLKIKFVLGKHRDADFTDADMVIKNPAVPSSSKYLKISKRVETDISIFLRLTRCRIIAVTGSKGKSTIVSAVYQIMKKIYPHTYLGGNITVSPLTFYHKIKKNNPVILELSSWQLADLKEKKLLKPEIAVITNIMNDHQNRYNCFEDYVNDKKLIYKDQDPNDISIFYDDVYGNDFLTESKGKSYIFSLEKPEKGNLEKRGWLEEGIGKFTEDGIDIVNIVPKNLSVPGDHFRLNMLIAAMILKLFGIDIKVINKELPLFHGVPHRMEMFASKRGMKFYNDSAATIPEATAAAVLSFETPLHLITGGTDKELDFTILENVISIPKAIYLLEGSGTDKLINVLKNKKIPWFGPFDSLNKALDKVLEKGEKNDSVILSPGSTSFGMFKNEFDRGNKFKELVLNL